jgi:hypothetical protein
VLDRSRFHCACTARSKLPSAVQARWRSLASLADRAAASAVLIVSEAPTSMSARCNASNRPASEMVPRSRRSKSQSPSVSSSTIDAFVVIESNGRSR